MTPTHIEAYRNGHWQAELPTEPGCYAVCPRNQGSRHVDLVLIEHTMLCVDSPLELCWFGTPNTEPGVPLEDCAGKMDFWSVRVPMPPPAPRLPEPRRPTPPRGIFLPDGQGGWALCPLEGDAP